MLPVKFWSKLSRDLDLPKGANIIDGTTSRSICLRNKSILNILLSKKKLFDL